MSTWQSSNETSCCLSRSNALARDRLSTVGHTCAAAPASSALNALRYRASAPLMPRLSSSRVGDTGTLAFGRGAAVGVFAVGVAAVGVDAAARGGDAAGAATFSGAALGRTGGAGGGGAMGAEAFSDAVLARAAGAARSDG